MQQRAIETRKKILDAAVRMYVSKGYHYTTVDEIAKEAGVSTGIAYKNFNNKKDLLLACLESLTQNIQLLSDTEKEDFKKCKYMEDMIIYALDQFVKIHRTYYEFHEELEGLRHSDEDVKNFYKGIEKTAIENICKEIQVKLGNFENLKERVYMAVATMEDYCHIAADIKDEKIDLEYMKMQTVKQVEVLFLIK